MYGIARDGGVPVEERWRRFRELRDELYASHPCSPLEPGARPRTTGLPYFPFDERARVLARAVSDPAEPFEVRLAADGTLWLARLAWLSFELYGRPRRLALYRLLGYGGGLFLPFCDASAGALTYGGGRYLLDTRKHADLGTEDGQIVLDFNFAYHPSCAYSPRWDCPLAPAENRLEVEVAAGERLPEAGWLTRAA